MGKRIVSILLAAALSLALLAVPAGAADAGAGTWFDDVADDAWYAQAVAWAVGEGVTNGITETAFGPDEICTRGQIITFLWRASGSPDPIGTIRYFGDVDSDAYYYKACQWAHERGMADDASFAPEEPCTRAMAVEFIWRQAGSPIVRGSSDFSDVTARASYAKAVAWAVGKGITNGITETTFGPDETCTRGQIVTFLFRYLGEKPQ